MGFGSEGWVDASGAPSIVVGRLGKWSRKHRVSGRWVALLRVSGAEQAVNGAGAETQLAECEAWARARGEEVVGSFLDVVPGRADALGRRTGLAEGWASLEGLEAEGFVVYRLDRLARDGWVREFLVHELEALGWAVRSCDPAEDDALLGEDSPTRRMIRTVMGAFSEYERDMVKFRLERGKQRKRLAGGYCGGGIPYGYRLNGARELVEDPHAMDLIAQGMTLRGLGVTFDAIGEYWLAGGMRLRKAVRFAPKTVRDVLARADANGVVPRALGQDAKHFLPTR